MEKPNVKEVVELILPIDRRSKIKDEGDKFLAEVENFKPVAGVEEEFLYEIPKILRAKAEEFEAQLKQWHEDAPLSSSEICVACGILNKARISAENRHFKDLSDWLGTKESRWKTKLHWRKKAYGTALILSFVGITTGYGTSVLRWLMSIAAIIIGFALLASKYLDYGSKGQGLRNALYWSVMTISTVGYGDITPKDHVVPQILAGAEGIIGLVMFIGLGMLIGEKARRP
jgi:hypothetical protein